jgi:hypothetical protein
MYKIISGILLILLIISVLFTLKSRREKEAYKQIINDQFNRRYLELEHKLKSSEQQRTVLVDSIAAVNIRTKSLLELNKQKDQEILKIKGKYKNHAPSELEKEMERRANGH